MASTGEVLAGADNGVGESIPQDPRPDRLREVDVVHRRQERHRIADARGVHTDEVADQ